MGEIGQLAKQIEKMVFSWFASDPSKAMAVLVENINRIDKKINDFFMRKLDEIVKLKDKDKFDESVIKNIEQIISAFNDLKQEAEQQKSDPKKFDSSKIDCLINNLHLARYKAYRDFEHEKDAWAVGGAANVAFKQLAGNQK